MNQPTKQSHLQVRTQLRVGEDKGFSQCKRFGGMEKCLCEFEVRGGKRVEYQANLAELRQCENTV